LIRIGMRCFVVLLAIAACGRGPTNDASSPPPPPHVVSAVAPADAGLADAPPAPGSALTTRGHLAIGVASACVHTAGDTETCWGRSDLDRATVVAGVDHVAGIVAAQSTTCAWTTTGAVWCSNGGPAKRVEGMTDAVQLATSAFVICARRASGAVACWSGFDKPGPVHDTAGITGALEIAVSGTTACIRDAAGIGCWNTDYPTSTSHRVPAATGATSLAGGHASFVALRGTQPPIGWHALDYTTLELPTLPADVVQIALGDDTACALGHTVQCWTVTDPASLHTIPDVDGALEIAVGYRLACARVDHHLACWGSVGSLGDGEPITTTTPVTVANLDDATRLAIPENSERTCAHRANGHVVCWGTNAKGGSDPAPVDVGTSEKAFARDRPGTRTWTGSNGRGSWTCTKADDVTCTLTFYGRHGENDTGPETGFGDLDDARDLRLPTTESDEVCVAHATGSVTCFPAFGGAGQSTAIDGVTDAIQLAASGEETCAVERAGTVKCWNPRFGHKVRTVAKITDAVEIAGGDVSACVRHRTGKVSCWGLRSLLGDNIDIHQTSPLVVPGVVTP
jgi:hypothetical protein